MSYTDPDRDYGEKLEALLDALEAVPEAEREDYLAGVCPELRREALAMLAAESSSTGYLEQFTSGLVPKQTVKGDLSGRYIGAYRLLHSLGQGGMGVVYAAERADGAFEQRVALKLLTTALTGTEAHRRFLAERSILAGLEHPSIARIIDGGVTDDGTPWFAMEHVEGMPIGEYCDHHRLDIRQRLELFLQVCDAVEHAHRRLVVHRDLKPGNVLVTQREGDRINSIAPEGAPTENIPTVGGPSGPKVKLLDFGIAKLLGGEQAGSVSPPTRTGLRLMTPEYASPEQVRGQTVTTASDVYQLGLLLYELLTGHRPYALRDRGAGDIERIICHQRPVRLSSAITREDTIVGGPSSPIPNAGNGAKAKTIGPEGPPTGGDGNVGGPSGPIGRKGRGKDAVATLCQVRRSTPAKLCRRLRGDLENIVGKALRKEPERRYGSADRLAQDIRRHLNGRPVTARADTWRYRSRKFVQRHALGTLTVAFVLALVGAMTVFYTVRIQSERDVAQLERDRAQTERDRAEAETAKAMQINQFVTSLFQGADPRQARGAELTARELLDLGVERVERELANQPEIQADMLHVLGRTYLELSLYEHAEDLLERARGLRQAEADTPETARILADLGLLRYRQGEYEAASTWLEQAAGMLEAYPEPHNVASLTNTLAILGSIYRIFGEYERARAILERALTIQIEATGEDSEPVVIILQSLGSLLTETGDFEQAEAHHRRALVIAEHELGPDHPRVGNILMNLANTRTNRGTLEDVESMHRRGISILEQAYGTDHAMVGIALHNLAHYLIVSGRDHDALKTLQRALSIYTEALGSDYPDIAYPHTSLGNVYTRLGETERAQYHYKQAITAREQLSETGHFDNLLFRGLVNLGRLETTDGNKPDAEKHFQQALVLWRQAPDINHTPIASSLTDLGRWLVEQARCAEAMPVLENIHAARQNLSDDQASEIEQLLTTCARY